MQVNTFCDSGGMDISTVSEIQPKQSPTFMSLNCLLVVGRFLRVYLALTAGLVEMRKINIMYTLKEGHFDK